ncbi:rotatin-like [Cimex lectularius]|uniref:Rotatin N-terminal domain-containing protein n=1 Tax=Cimex lectularius TaxID=79782 RepID=A0A8I6RXN5_CIMLE|nr:rotatin-like [Cimex lectularius]
MGDGLRLTVKKLGHELEEIRLRALDNILTKLNLHIIAEDQLLDEPDLFPLLVKWFQFSSVPKKSVVLQLILRLVKSKDGLDLLLRQDPDLLQIRNGIDEEEKQLFEKLCSLANISPGNIKKTTSRTKNGFHVKEGERKGLSTSWTESVASNKLTEGSLTSECFSERSESSRPISPRVDLSFHSSLASGCVSFPTWKQVYWPSPTLATSDKKVLTTVLNSLRDGSQRDQAAHFFSTVILQDFPPQVFLNDTSILLVLLEMVEKDKSNERALTCLEDLTKALLVYFKYYSDCSVISLNCFMVDDKLDEQIDIQGGGDSNLTEYHYTENMKNKCFDSQVVGLGDFCALVLDKIGPVIPSIFPVIALSISNAELFWNAMDAKAGPLKHSLTSTLSSLAHNLLRAKGIGAIKRLNTQILAAKLLKAAVPQSVCYVVVPKDMQEAMSASLLDPILYLLQPRIHRFFLSYVRNFKYHDSKTYNEFISMALSLEAAAKFLKCHKELPFIEMIDCFKDSLLGLEIHKEYKIIELFFKIIDKDDLSQSHIESIQALTAKLLASSDAKAKVISYKMVVDAVNKKLGPKANSLETNHYSFLLFVLNRKVFKEIVYYGLSNEDSDVRQCSEVILVLILKSQILVPASSWRWLISEMSTVFSVLQAYADLNSSLGRTILQMLDPDTSKEIMLPVMEVLTGNIRLMMSKSKDCKNEATARVIYLLNIPSNLDINESFNLGDNPISSRSSAYGGYEEGSLIKVLEVLATNPSDPQILKSALTQLSLIMEDKCLHIPFLDYKGLNVILSFLHSSVTNMSEGSKSIFTNSVVILKHLARHNTQLRHDFFLNYDMYDSILKGLFLYNDDWRLLRDVSQLLTLMVFADVVVTTSDSVSFPQAIIQKMKLPFEATPHSQVSDNYQPSKIEDLLSNKNVKSSLALLWLVESLEGGIKEIAESQVQTSGSLHLPVSQISIEDLITCYIPHNVNKLLVSLNCSNSHADAQSILKQLKSYMKLAQLCDSFQDLHKLQWETTFLRYLTTLPASVQDQLLLVEILQFLTFSAKFIPELLSWLSGIVKDPAFTLNSLLTRITISDNTALGKELSIRILSLVETCLKNSEPDGWEYVTNTLLQCLSHSHTQKFYSIAVMDKLLKCLLQLTELKIFLNPKCLWQLLNAFHCATPYSCMGLTITRLTVLCLCNLLVLKPKGKKFWLPSETKWLQSMIGSKDLIVKSATLELLSGLTLEFSQQVVMQFPELWETSLNILLDHNEASLVREQAANLCSNLIATSEDKTHVQLCISTKLFSCISIVAARLNFSSSLKQTVIRDFLFTSFSSSPYEYTEISSVTTPNLFIACCRITLSLLSKEKEEVISAMHTQGLVTELFRHVSQWQSCKTLCNQDRVDMYAMVLQVLTHCTHLPATCVKDCVPTLVWLLQDSTYCEEVNKKMILNASLRLLGSIASNQKNIDVIFTLEAIESLCLTTVSDDGVTATAVAHLIPFLTSEANVEIVKALKGNCPLTHRFLIASILGCSHSGTKAALECGLLEPLIVRLKETHVSLAIMPPDVPRSKKANTVLHNLSIDLCLLINFIAGSAEAKLMCVNFGLADIIHKLWAWCLLDVVLISTLLQVLITYTANSPQAAATLVLTSTMAGVGQRKTPTSSSILHATIGLFSRDVYSIELRKMVLELLSHACQALEARIVMNKSNLLNEFLKIGQTRKTSQLEDLEICWLRFFVIFSSFPEGQASLMKNEDIMEQFLEFLSIGKPELKTLSLSIFRNLVLNPANKQRFIVSDKFLRTISNWAVDPSITENELQDVLLIAWFIAANSQRGKFAVRNVNLDGRLQLAVITYPEQTKIAQLAKKVLPIIKSS